MRVVSIITAGLVCAVLYFVILDRGTLIELAARFGPDQSAAEPMEDGAIETAQAGGEAVAEDEPGEAADGAIHVVARRSEAFTTDDAVRLRGRTEAARQVTVSAETSGRIISEPIRAGAFVEEGQVLCRIDPGTREAQLSEARARLNEARARLPEARARLAEAEAQLTAAQIEDAAAARLSESGLGSESRAASTAAQLRAAEAAIVSAEAGVEAAASGVQSAQAAVDRAEEEISRLDIAAPFDGLLESDTAELGSLMQPGSPCATIIQLDPMKIVGFVPEAHVDRVEVGAEAGARLSSGAEVVGEVTFVSRSADPQTRTFRVEVRVDNSDLSIRDGQTADILVRSRGRLAHLLPSSAMTLNDAGTLGVRIVNEDGIVEFAPVTVLRDSARGVYLAGLPEVVDVITVGQEFVTAGVPVRVTYEDLGQ